ncbi:hypothetical protein BGW39_004096 [Mortierella sp. 14UC]|nr:hypothetical protein BGW39_004096 [Mortierella sp. 14UC]
MKNLFVKLLCELQKAAQTKNDGQTMDTSVEELKVGMLPPEQHVGHAIATTATVTATRTTMIAITDTETKSKQSYDQFFKWTNWAKNQTCRPSSIIQPRTMQDTIDIVQSAKAEQKKIRCVAGGYTWSSASIVPENGILVFVDKMARIFAPVYVEGLGWTVELENGVTVEALDEFLRRHDPPLAMPSNIVMETHGSATHSRTLSDLACEVKIVDANGNLNTFTYEKDPAEFSAAACNLGLLGVIYSYTLQVEPMFRLTVVFHGHYSRKGNRLGTGRERDRIWVKQWRRTDQPLTGSTAWKSIRVVRQYLSCFIGGILLKTMVATPRTTPLINCGISKVSKGVISKVLEAPDAIHYQHNIQDMVCVGTEFVFKVDEGFERPSKAWRFAIDKIYEHAAHGKYPVNMIMDMRFIKASDQIMLYAYDKDPEAVFCTIEVLSAANTKGFEKFTAMLAEHFISEYQARQGS